MRVEHDNLRIELQNQDEIENFWNIVEFALDLHAERTKKGESCMTKDELQMATRLAELTEIKW